MKPFRLYLAGLLALFAGYVLVEYYRPRPLDWTPTFVNRDKIPYGTYALYDLLPGLLQQPRVRTVRLPPFNQLADNPTDSPANYLFVSRSFRADSLDARELLRFAARGNTVLIAAENLDDVLGDTLGIDTDFVALPGGREWKPTDSVALHLVNPRVLPGRTFRYPISAAAWRLQADSAHRATLRVLAADEQQRPVLLRAPHGRGQFLVCSVPIVFTNYFVLHPRTSDFAWAALSYVPAGRVTWWDEYQKQGREGQQSLLRVVLGHEALRVAWYLLLAGTVLFVLFEAKRRQRIIPVMRPLPNTSLQFAQTVAGLYRQGNNHQAIANQKIDLFLEYLRTRFHEKTDDLTDENLRQRLSEKSGVARTKVDELLRQLNIVRTAPQVDDHQLLHLSELMRRFRRAAR